MKIFEKIKKNRQDKIKTLKKEIKKLNELILDEKDAKMKMFNELMELQQYTDNNKSSQRIRGLEQQLKMRWLEIKELKDENKILLEELRKKKGNK